MSKYWGYNCTTCDDRSPRWFNHGEHILEIIQPLLPHFKAVRESELYRTWDCEITIMGVHEYPGPIDWLLEHEGHDVVIVNEYEQTIEEDKAYTEALRAKARA